MARIPTAKAHRDVARRRVTGLGGVALVVLATLLIGGVAWAALSATVANATSTFGSATMQLEGTTPTSVSCYSTGSGSGGSVSTSDTATCPGDPLPTGQLGTTGVSASTTLAALGTAAPTSATIAPTPSTSCGAQDVADSAGTNTGLAMGGVAYQQGGPTTMTGDNGIGFTANANGWFETTSSYSTPSNFTILAWFKANTGTTGGSVFGISNSQFNSGASSSNLNVWVNNSDHLVLGVDTFAVLGIPIQSEVTSSATIGSGWNFVAVTQSALTTTLYLNGTSVGTALSVALLSSYTGYIDLGWGAESSTGWSGSPTSAYFNGIVSMVSVQPAALSSSQLTTLDGETTASAYESQLSTDSTPTYNWQMKDTGLSLYPSANTIPGSSPSVSACALVEETVKQIQSMTTTCVIPTSSCVTPTSSNLLSGFTASHSLDVPASGSPVVVEITMAVPQAATLGVNGLDVQFSLTFSDIRTSWSANVAYSTDSAVIEL